MSGQQHAPAAIYPLERPGTHCTGGCVGPRVGLDERKLRTHRDSIPDRPTPSSVAIPTELPGPHCSMTYLFFSGKAMCYIFWGCVCSLSFPVCNAHAPYFHPWPVRLYYVAHWLINDMIFETNYWAQNVCLVILYSSVWSTFHAKKDWAWHDQKYVSLHIQYRYYCQILIKLEFSRQIFEKYTNIKFHENPSGVEQSCSTRTDGRTDRGTDRQMDCQPWRYKQSLFAIIYVKLKTITEWSKKPLRDLEISLPYSVTLSWFKTRFIPVKLPAALYLWSICCY